MALSPREEAILVTLGESLRADDPALADALGIAPSAPAVAVLPPAPDAPVPRADEPATASPGDVLLRFAVCLGLLVFAAVALPPLGQALLGVMVLFVATPCLLIQLLGWVERSIEP